MAGSIHQKGRASNVAARKGHPQRLPMAHQSMSPPLLAAHSGQRRDNQYAKRVAPNSHRRRYPQFHAMNRALDVHPDA